MKAALYCEGSRTVGLGHLAHCLTLGRELRERNVQVVLFTNNDPHVIAKFVEHGYLHRIFETRKKLPALIENDHVDVIFADSNEAQKDDMQALTRVAATVNLAVQGPAKWYADLSLLHSPIIDGPRPADARAAVLTGPQFAILSPEFSHQHGAASKRDQVRKLLVAMGGGDAMGFTKLALQALRLLDTRVFSVTFVTGAAFKPDPAFQLGPHHCEHRHDVQNMAALMAEVDLALLAMGTTTYEAMCLGLPTLNLCPTRFHEKLAREYQNQGVLLSAGIPDASSIKDIAQKLRTLIDDTTLRWRLSDNASALVDGKGSTRVVSHAFELLRGKPRGELV